MKIIEGHKYLSFPLENPVVTLGNFDGVHRGHQEILSRVRARAEELKGVSVVYTFHPHPLAVLAPGKQFLSITTLEEKLGLIEQNGIDLAICEPFDQEFSRISAEVFVKDILCDTIGVKEIFVGEDYAFGAKRQGNIYYLQQMGKLEHFRVRVVESKTIDTIIVKSSKIREFIQMGQVGLAAQLLGHCFCSRGLVTRGKGRGEQLGFPTANLKLAKALHPGVGVYAVWVTLEGSRFPGAMNVGFNPTFQGQELSPEVHILDFDPRPLYDREVEICFVERIRDEKTFANAEALIAQMHEDVASVRNLLGAAGR
jgi:riboflavin kinase / FMN adenylyltransferase